MSYRGTYLAFWVSTVKDYCSYRISALIAKVLKNAKADVVVSRLYHILGLAQSMNVRCRSTATTRPCTSNMLRWR
jgi:hypothetical protein